MNIFITDTHAYFNTLLKYNIHTKKCTAWWIITNWMACGMFCVIWMMVTWVYCLWSFTGGEWLEVGIRGRLKCSGVFCVTWVMVTWVYSVCSNLPGGKGWMQALGNAPGFLEYSMSAWMMIYGFIFSNCIVFSCMNIP